MRKTTTNSECPIAKAKAEGVECWRHKIRMLASLPDSKPVTTRVLQKKEQTNA